jgi:hypothetical protein
MRTGSSTGDALTVFYFRFRDLSVRIVDSNLLPDHTLSSVINLVSCVASFVHTSRGPLGVIFDQARPD